MCTLAFLLSVLCLYVKVLKTLKCWGKADKCQKNSKCITVLHKDLLRVQAIYTWQNVEKNIYVYIKYGM